MEQLERKYKVVWLCHFADQSLKKFFNNKNVNEFAPWISLLINEAEKDHEIELHIVAPNVFENRKNEFKRNGIHYHFFKYKQTLIPRNIYNKISFGYLTNFRKSRKEIKKIVNKILPDIVHLHGTENPYYSVGIFSLHRKFKTLVTIQGFILTSTLVGKSTSIDKRVKIEKRILTLCENFGIRAEFMKETIRKFKPDASFYWHNYPIRKPLITVDTTLKYFSDLVFFARISKDKGIEDLICALKIIKEQISDVSLAIYGPCSQKYKQTLLELADKNDVKDNLSFMSFIETQDKLFEKVVRSKISVLPTYHDIIPGTIIESMMMKLPVVAYASGGIPDLNRNDVERLVLVKKGDIEGLAKEIILLLNDSLRSKKIAEAGYQYCVKYYNNENAYLDIKRAYINIIHNNVNVR